MVKNAVLAILMGWYDKNNCKPCLEQVSGHFGTKSINKKKISVFAPKNHDFQKKIPKGSKSPFLSSETWLDGFFMKF